MDNEKTLQELINQENEDFNSVNEEEELEINEDDNRKIISIMNGDQYPSDLCSHIHNRYLKGEFDNLSKGDQIVANVLI